MRVLWTAAAFRGYDQFKSVRCVTLVFLVLRLSAAATTETQFSKTLYPVLEKAACRACHSPDGVASATRLHFPDAAATSERIERFGKSLVVLINRSQPDQSLLLNKPTNRVVHVGGERIMPGSPEETALRVWVGRLAKMTGDDLARALKYKEEIRAGMKAPSTPELRRLTHSQYNNTVRDLFGELSQPANQFAPEDFVYGFKNQFQAQNLSPALFEAYSTAAEKLARNAFRRGDAKRLIGCEPSPDCQSQFVRSLGLKVFRRPLNASEQKRYQALIVSAPEFFTGAQTVVEAMLQSPHFLFYLDAISDPALQPYAAASRLSYTLWNTMPDEALLRAAANGELSHPAGFERAARRMLADPRAKEALDEFVTQWMRFDRVLTTSRDRRFYKFPQPTAIAMTEETRRFFSDLVWGDRNFMELFTATYGYVNAGLAEIYGLPTPETPFDRVPFTVESERGGLLGQALFLTLTSKPDGTSPTARGLFVREQFLCQHVPNPPPGVSTNLPPINELKPQTNRQRLAAHATDKSCATCHNLLDPIGFGLEKFDAIGARHETAKLVFYPVEKNSKEKPKMFELPLDTSGSVAGIPGSNFSSPRELGQILARTPQCQECVVKQYFRYASGRPETEADGPVIRKAFDTFRNSQFRFQEMMTALLVARQFPESSSKYVARNQALP